MTPNPGCIFHIWSCGNGDVLCGDERPDRILHIAWAERINRGSLCAACVAKLPALEATLVNGNYNCA